MVATQQVEEALALLGIANTSFFKFWVGGAKKQQARDQFRDLVRNSQELRTTLEERALRAPGESQLWYALLDALGEAADTQFFARAIGGAVPVMRYTAVRRLDSLIPRQQSEKVVTDLKVVREEDLPALSGDGRSFQGTVDLLLAGFESALRQGDTEFQLVSFLFEVCEKRHLYPSLMPDECHKMPAGPLCDGITLLIVRTLRGEFGADVRKRIEGHAKLRYEPPDHLKRVLDSQPANAAVKARSLRVPPEAFREFLGTKSQ